MDDRYTWFLGADGGYSRSFSACAGEELNLTLKGNTVPDPLQRTTDELGFVNYSGSRTVDEAQVYTVNLATGALTQIGGAVTGNLNVIGLIAALACLAGIIYMLFFKKYQEAVKLTRAVKVS
jgi:hypothetical protein